MTSATQIRGAGDRLRRQGATTPLEWILEPDDTAAVPQIRRGIMDGLTSCAAPGSDLDAAELIVGELLGNAIAHTGGPAWITLRWPGAHPRLTVADQGPGFDDPDPAPALPDDPLADGGRGLFIVSRLARDVTVVPRPGGGTVVSVTLDLRHRC